jgi:hypothetical protein
LTFSPFNGDGVCFPLCTTPTFDRNANGTIDDDEKGLRRDCGPDFACTTTLALAADLYAAAPEPDGVGARSCDPIACPEGAPCDACGAGDATCSMALGEPLCLAPFGACEPR